VAEKTHEAIGISISPRWKYGPRLSEGCGLQESAEITALSLGLSLSVEVHILRVIEFNVHDVELWTGRREKYKPTQFSLLSC